MNEMQRPKINKKELRAGLLPYVIIRNKEGKKIPVFLFMVPSNPEMGGPRPQIAKGRIEYGETPLQAALREANEEIGIKSEDIVGNVSSIGLYLGYTYVFVCKVKGFDVGSPGHETEKLVWADEKKFERIGRKIHIPVVKAAARAVARREKLYRKRRNKKESNGGAENDE